MLIFLAVRSPLDAGLLPLRAFDQRYGLTRGLAERVCDDRDDSRVSHPGLSLLRQRLYQRVLSALRHPNIVKIIDHGIGHDQAFFVMEFVDGEPLNALLGRVRKCDKKFAIRIVRSAAETFSDVHEQGIVETTSSHPT